MHGFIMSLELGPTLLVLLAAALHATWNALVKAGRDKLATQTAVTFFSGLSVVPLLPFVSFPAQESWPFLVISIVVHGVYYVSLVNAYRHGDLSQVYPIARGAAPLMIALGAWGFADERLSLAEAAGVAIVSAGIMSLAAPGRIARDGEIKAIGFALATSVTIALYSISDGMGVRRAGQPMSYIVWLFALEAVPVLLAGLWLRRGRIVAAFGPTLVTGSIGGFISALGYGIVIWAMSLAPIAHVSALRETSVILAAAIGTLFLGERFGLRRVVAAAIVAGGAALLHLNG